MRPRRAALAALLVSAVSVAAFRGDDRRSEQAMQLANEKRAQIRAEVDRLGPHDWAGEYYRGSGLGVSQSLSVAPQAGYVYEWRGCVGWCDRNFGEIVVDGQNLLLSFTFENARGCLRGLTPVLSVVHWGSRRYLVSPDEIIGFCNDVNSGAEPRTDMHGSDFLRRGDEKQVVTGFPELPHEYRKYLLANPIQARIVAADPASKSSAGAGRWCTRLTLDAGAAQGLLVGMELAVVEPHVFLGLARLTKVDEDRSAAVLTQWGAEISNAREGWLLSTRYPWYDR